MEDCESYLGLPMVGGKSKVNTCKDLHEIKDNQKSHGLEGKNYFKGREGDPHQNSCSSYSDLLHAYFQNLKSFM